MQHILTPVTRNLLMYKSSFSAVLIFSSADIVYDQLTYTVMVTVDSKFTDAHISRPPTFEGKNCPKFFALNAEYTVINLNRRVFWHTSLSLQALYCTLFMLCVMANT